MKSIVKSCIEACQKCLVDMKLNGKIYITKNQVINELEEVILDVELRNFDKISTDLDDLDSNELDAILQLLEAAKYDIGLLFKVTKYSSKARS